MKLTKPPLPSGKEIQTAPVVFALDLSIARTGWALSDLDGVQFDAVSFAGRGGAHPALRFIAFRDFLTAMLNQHQPDFVLYEESDPRHMKSGAGVNCAVGLRTVLEMECATRQIPTRQIMPNALKKAFTSAGNADKELMKADAARRFASYDRARDEGGDIADALAVLAVWLDTPEKFTGRAISKRSLESPL